MACSALVTQMPESLALLRFTDVVVAFNDKLVLDRVSLTIHAGETVALLGPSGAGKTTLLRLALGFLRPSGGSIEVCGTNIVGLDERRLRTVRKNLGVVFQNGALFTSKSVEENVAYAISEGAQSDPQTHAAVMTTLANMDLEQLAERMPDELSGGQAQRVAVARAIIREPRVMLYDEPTQGLDPQRALSVCHEIERLSRTGVASLVITHQFEYARRYAERVVLLENTRIRFDGSPDDMRMLDNAFAQSFFDVLDWQGTGRNERA